MHLVAAVFALTVFALWRASTTKRHTHTHTHTTHTHKQKQYKFILPRLLRATALGHSLGAQPAAQNLSTARKFRIRSKLALRAIKAGRGGRGVGCQGARGRGYSALHSALLPRNVAQRKVLIRLLFATFRFGLFSFPFFLFFLLLYSFEFWRIKSLYSN